MRHVTGFQTGADVLVDLTDDHPEHQEFLHYGTVYKTKPDRNGGHVYRVSGLPRRWLTPDRLAAAERPVMP